MVDAADYVLDAKAEIEDELARRCALWRGVGRYGDACEALALLEHHLVGPTRPLDVGDRVMIGAEQGVDAVPYREVVDAAGTSVEHHDLDAGAPSRRRPSFSWNAGTSDAVGFDRDVPRHRCREIAYLSRHLAERLGRQGARIAHGPP